MPNSSHSFLLKSPSLPSRYYAMLVFVMALQFFFIFHISVDFMCSIISGCDSVFTSLPNICFKIFCALFRARYQCNLLFLVILFICLLWVNSFECLKYISRLKSNNKLISIDSNHFLFNISNLNEWTICPLSLSSW
jgi:hypothetical protein